MSPRCRIILPTVYDDSLSYYETLCKFRNALIEMQNVINNKIDDYIKDNLNGIIFNAIYDEANEKIIFGFEDISTGCDIHSYNPATNTLTISKEV